MEAYYDMIFKRKSMRKFDSTLSVSNEEMQAIEQQLQKLVPLDANVHTAFRIVDVKQTTCKWGEHCLLCYGEHTERSLLNAGYLLEQMDLFLASMDIGVCWYGLSKPDLKQWEGVPYIIMLAFGKSRPGDFRMDIANARRQPREVIWQGEFDEKVITSAHYAPSAINMQPWRVQSHENEIRVFRTTNLHSIMPVWKRPFFNTIDLGIFLCFLETSLLHHGYKFQRVLLDAQRGEPTDKHSIPIATYTLT